MMAEAVVAAQYQPMREGLRKVSRTVGSLLNASLLDTGFGDPRGFFFLHGRPSDSQQSHGHWHFVACALFVKSTSHQRG